MQNVIEKLPLDSDIYRAITKISYTDNIPVSDIINRMLREHLNVYLLWRRVGYVLLAKDILMTSIANTPDEELVKAAHEVANRHREACILLYGTSPNLDSYIRLIKSFTAVNNFEVDLSKSGENDVMVVQFRMNKKYSLYLGNVYRILLEDFCTVHRFEITENLAFFEYSRKTS
ncbi:MAG: hypothetical protein ABI347_02635 [Nitrososphaera sp.]